MWKGYQRALYYKLKIRKFKVGVLSMFTNILAIKEIFDTKISQLENVFPLLLPKF